MGWSVRWRSFSNRDRRLRREVGKRVAAYPNFNPLMSGWIEGEKRIRQKGALWDIKLGKGHVILFGFKPQHRAQSHGTFKLLFNAIYYSVVGR